MFYDRLNDICKNQNLKITNVLKELNISMGNTSKWKNGTIPNGKILILLADKLGVSVDYLLERTNNPEVNK
ncbi:MAG: helix-turn-helix transcriptional regulator [Clostridia bacterium]|nr:helix-turn-helix transcriptional regulator [Clostridia bacterium]